MWNDNAKRLVMGGAASALVLVGATALAQGSRHVGFASSLYKPGVYRSIGSTAKKARANAKNACLRAARGKSWGKSCQNLKVCGPGWYATVRMPQSGGVWGHGVTCGHRDRKTALQQARNICNKGGGRNCQYDARKF